VPSVDEVVSAELMVSGPDPINWSEHHRHDSGICGSVRHGRLFKNARYQMPPNFCAIVPIACLGASRFSGKRPVKSSAAHIQDVGHVLLAVAFFYELSGVLDLFG